MDKKFLERLSASTCIYVNFEKAIQEKFNFLPYQNRRCHVHYTDSEVRDLRLAGDLKNPQQINFLTISYQTKKRDYLVHTQVNPEVIENSAIQHGIKVEVTKSRRVLDVQTRIAAEHNDPDHVVAFLLTLSQSAFECLI